MLPSIIPPSQMGHKRIRVDIEMGIRPREVIAQTIRIRRIRVPVVKPPKLARVVPGVGQLEVDALHAVVVDDVESLLDAVGDGVEAVEVWCVGGGEKPEAVWVDVCGVDHGEGWGAVSCEGEDFGGGCEAVFEDVDFAGADGRHFDGIVMDVCLGLLGGVRSGGGRFQWQLKGPFISVFSTRLHSWCESVMP